MMMPMLWRWRFMAGIFLRFPGALCKLDRQTIVEIRPFGFATLSPQSRAKSRIINRARQDLAWQFPEVALVRSVGLG
jgi:hypothetical protein